MPRIDESRPFLAVNIAVLTVSDTRTLADDKSGQTLADMIARDGHKLAARTIVKDDVASIVAQLWRTEASPQPLPRLRPLQRPGNHRCRAVRPDRGR